LTRSDHAKYRQALQDLKDFHIYKEVN
jgi:hypothetical protein